MASTPKQDNLWATYIKVSITTWMILALNHNPTPSLISTILTRRSPIHTSQEHISQYIHHTSAHSQINPIASNTTQITLSLSKHPILQSQKIQSITKPTHIHPHTYIPQPMMIPQTLVFPPAAAARFLKVYDVPSAGQTLSHLIQ